LNKVKFWIGVLALAGLFAWWTLWGLMEWLRNLANILG